MIPRERLMGQNRGGGGEENIMSACSHFSFGKRHTLDGWRL